MPCAALLRTQMGIDLLDFNLVARFGLRKQLTVKTLDLRNLFGDEGVQPTHGPGNNTHLLRFRSLQRLGRSSFMFLPVSDVSAIKAR